MAARPNAKELMDRVRVQQARGRTDDQEVPTAVTSLPPRETAPVAPVSPPEPQTVTAEVPVEPTPPVEPAPPVESTPPVAAPLAHMSLATSDDTTEPTRNSGSAESAPPVRRQPPPVATPTRRGPSAAAAVVVVTDFVDPRQWVPIAPGKEGFAKKAPMVNAELVDVLETLKTQVQRATRRKVSWDQVMALAADQLPKSREFIRELEARRGRLGLDDPSVPRRRVAGMIPYAVADHIEDLARDAEQSLGRRVAMEDVWAVALSLVLDAIEQGSRR